MSEFLSRPEDEGLTNDEDEDSTTSVYVRRLMRQSGGHGHPSYPRVPASLVEYKTARLLITSRPSNYVLLDYIKTLHEHHVTDVVRTCVSVYDVTALKREGVATTDMVYEDGATPDAALVDQWLELLKSRFALVPDCCVAVHCEEGLGRSPLLVGVALLELGMRNDEVVTFLRARRREVLNYKQVNYLTKYQAKYRLIKGKTSK